MYFRCKILDVFEKKISEGLAVNSEEEQAILALTEEVTLISSHVSDATYQRAAKLFDEHYLAQVIMAIVAINAWNRIAITTGMRPE